MIFKLFSLTLLLSLVSVAFGRYPPYPYPYYSCYWAHRQCDFRFEGRYGGLRTFSIQGPPDVAFTPRIISKDYRETLGILNSNNIAPEFINRDFSATPINHVYAKQRLTPTHFKPYTIKKTPFSGIGHQTFHQNQKAVSTHKCIRVWFTEYQVLKSWYHPIVKANKNNVPKYRNKCVVFFTR